MSSSYWCQHLVLDGQIAHAVKITVVDNRIQSVTPHSDPAGSTRLNGLTVPGFANAHSHAFHRALRGRTQANRGTFWTWRDLMYSVAQKLTPDSYHRLARAVFAEMAMAGISAVGEFHYVHHQPDGSAFDDPNAMGEALLAAAAEAGIRITLLDTLYLHGGLEANGYVPPTGAQIRYCDESERWADRVEALRTSEQQLVGCAIHSVRAVDPAAMAMVSAWAKNHDAPLHAHMSEQQAENEQCLLHHGCTPAQLLSDAGAFDANFTAVHATHLTEADIDLLGASGASVCMCPTTERDLGDGIGPTSELVQAGVPLCLGSDSHAVIDQMEEARALELDERLRTEQRGLHSATELLDMATQNGHCSIGWNDAGSVVVGNRADLTTVTLDSVRTAGASAELGLESVIFSATAADVTSVVVDGVQIVADGVHSRINVESELRASIEELLS